MDNLLNPGLVAMLPMWMCSTLRFALVKYGAGIVQMSGSIAGDVHARNRFGNYIRPRTKPVNPNSERQAVARTTMSFLSEYWHEDLTVVQRAAWDTYAAAVAMKNRIGETIHLTGFNHFVRTNAARWLVYSEVDEGAPVTLSLPEKDPDLVCSEEAIAGQTFTFTCNVGGWGANGDPKLNIMLYQGQPQLASRMFFGGPYRYMDIIDSTEGAAGTGTYTAVFPFGLGQKVWFEARLMTGEGRLTERWLLGPRTIVADV